MSRLDFRRKSRPASEGNPRTHKLGSGAGHLGKGQTNGLYRQDFIDRIFVWRGQHVFVFHGALMTEILDELCAEVEHNANRYFDDEIERWRRKYDRSRLAELRVKVPPHSLHDYSETGTEIVIAALKVRRDTLIRIRIDRRWPLVAVRLTPADMYHLAPIYGALKAERLHLAAEQGATKLEKLVKDAAA